jgi:hypothetical protein
LQNAGAAARWFAPPDGKRCDSVSFLCVFRVDRKRDDLGIGMPISDLLDDGRNDGLVAEVLVADMTQNADSFHRRPTRHGKVSRPRDRVG